MSKTNTRMLLRCAVFAALTAVGAFIRIPFALSSITLQFFFTAMAGLVLGARWGAGIAGDICSARSGRSAYLLRRRRGRLHLLPLVRLPARALSLRHM